MQICIWLNFLRVETFAKTFINHAFKGSTLGQNSPKIVRKTHKSTNIWFEFVKISKVFDKKIQMNPNYFFGKFCIKIQ